MNKRFAPILPSVFAILLAVGLSPGRDAQAQPWSGDNQPGEGRAYEFFVPTGVTNLSLRINNSSTAFSHLCLRRAATASTNAFDFAVRQGAGATNLNLQLPELVAGTNFSLWVQTPANSLAHNFTVELTTNRADARSWTMPILKPLVFSVAGSLTGGTSNLFQIDVPTNLPGWRLVLDCQGAANLSIRRGAFSGVPLLKQSTHRQTDTLFLDGTAATAHTYFVVVTLEGGNLVSDHYQLSAELATTVPLTWDDGTTPAGTSVFTNQSLLGGDYFFTLTPTSAASGIWRTKLNVTSGDAQLYLRQTSPPALYGDTLPAVCDRSSAQPGDDAVVMVQGTAYATNAWGAQYKPGEVWHLMVVATPGSEWSLSSGNAFIPRLPPPTAGTGGGTNFTLGPEGMAFFRTSLNTNTIAWRLGLNGATNPLLVFTNRAAHPYSTTHYHWRHDGQLLLVPPYLQPTAEYFVTVVGRPGETLTLDSRQQPIYDLDFNAATSVVASNYGYITFRVEVPESATAWQLDLVTDSSNGPNLAVRRQDVANEYMNTAFDEANNRLMKTITLVGPTLTDGMFYLTVYGTPPFTANLTNSRPVRTPKPFEFTLANDQPERVGWRFYNVTNPPGILGWELLLSDQAPGTEITLRENDEPGRWVYRNNAQQSLNQTATNRFDAASTTGFLQRIRHQAGNWVIGIHSPNQPLGPFRLTSRAIPSESVALSSSFATTPVTGQAAGFARFFQVDVPTNALGLEVHLRNVTSGDPRLVVCRQELPLDLSSRLSTGSPWSNPFNSQNWANRAQIAPAADWTGYLKDILGVNEQGRYFFAGRGNPLEPGTYHIGVMSGTGPGSGNAMAYDLNVRGLFPDASFTDLAFSGGTSVVDGLLPHDVSWHRVVVPANTPSWKVRLELLRGDALLVLRANGLPSYVATGTSPTTTTGCKLKKVGNEHYLLLPTSPNTTIAAGTYYLGVVSEGENPTPPTATGTGTCDFALTSVGALPIVNLGTVDPAGQTALSHVQAVQEGGEILTYQFTILPDTPVFEARLLDRVGNPHMWLRADGRLATASTYPYGFSGGDTPKWKDASLIRIPRPSEGLYTLVVQAGPTNTSAANPYPNASYTLQVSAQTTNVLAFDGGWAAITNQSSDSWQYFSVTVPEDALGWDLRLTNITAGDPRLVICRGLFPSALTTVTSNATPVVWSPYSITAWPPGAQLAVGNDWTGWQKSATGANALGTVFMAPRGNPLVAGTYVVGITSGTEGRTTNPMRYTLVSRGIGTNYAIPIRTLAYAGGQDNRTGQVPREAAYYQVEVPSNAPSWEVGLTFSQGDGLLLVRKDGLPNFAAGQTTNLTNLAGCKLQKRVNEHFVLLPHQPSETIPAGTYYLGVVSEGENPTSPRIGSGSSSYALTNYGAMPVEQLGEVDWTGANAIERSVNLDGGQIKAYQFDVLPGTLAVVVRLDNVTGAPSMSLLAGSILPETLDSYGRQGGWIADLSHSNYMRLLEPVDSESRRYTLLVQAGPGPGSGNYPAARYDLRIYSLIRETTELPFDGGAISRQLISKEWNYFSVKVPADALGWDLRLTNVVSGDPRLVICRAGYPIGLTNRQTNGTTWAWTNNPTWPRGFQIGPGLDWTGYGLNADSMSQTGRVFAVGRGNPLQGGSTYYIGVSSGTASGANDPMEFTIVSRGIGGTNSIPVTPLGESNLTISATGLGVREAAYYSFEVPTNTPAWRLSLANSTGEALLAVQKDFLPNIGAATNAPAALVSGGHKFQKTGTEHALLGPLTNQTLVEPGTYYVAVVGEGSSPAGNRAGAGLTDYTLTRTVSAPPINLGHVLTGADARHTNSLANGESITYQFTIPKGAEALAVSLTNYVGTPTNCVGTPHLQVRADDKLALDNALYGQDGGNKGVAVANFRYVTNRPANQEYSVTVSALRSGQTFPGLDYMLWVHVEDDTPGLDFDGGTNRVMGQAVNARRYFRVEVPTNALGWDLRLTNVTSGNPRLAIRREDKPVNFISTPLGFKATDWTKGQYMVPTNDWTGFNEADGSSSTGRVFQVGMNNPLKPGTYYVGVTNFGTTVPASYTIVSRGIGDGYSVPVTELSVGADTGPQTLPAREAAWYRVTVPANRGSWKVALSANSGEALLLAQRDALPNLGAHTDNFIAQTNGGKIIRKRGDEHLLALGSGVDGYLTPGTYYLGVVSEGLNPDYSRARLGTGTTEYSLWSGESPPADLGIAGVLPASVALAAGESKTWQFTVSNLTAAVEVSLEAASNAPFLTLARGSFPPSGTNLAGAIPTWAANRYGWEGGFLAGWRTARLLTLPNPAAGTYSMTTRGDPAGDSSFTLRVQSLPVGALSFDARLNSGGLSDTVTNELAHERRAYYRVEVPALLDGQPVLGWRLSLRATQGSPVMRVRKGQLPADGANDSYSSAYYSRDAAFLPAFLSSGTWFVEVKATGDSDYSLTSAAVRPTATLSFDERLNAPGINHQVSFVLPGDQRAYYRVEIPALLAGQPVLGWRLNLEPNNSQPLMRVRKGSLPNDPDASGFEREAVFVPEFLSPGTWYVEIQASANCSGTLSSSALELERAAWQMPARGQRVTTPGLTTQVHVFGDTGVDPAGGMRPVPGDIELRQTGFHYYAVVVPPGNAGLLRTKLESFSGNPNLYLRAFAPPTLSHGADGTSGELFERALTNTSSFEFGNWAVLDGRVDTQLAPGLWYLAVHAAGDSNVRYRLQLSTGDIAELPFAGGGVTNQVLAAGDWRYYRVRFPAATTEPMTEQWTLRLEEQLGDVVLHLRDTLPPGQGNHVAAYVDWDTDKKNGGPYPTHASSGPWILTVPPVRPDAVYYVGVRAERDATFTLRSEAGSTPIGLDGVIPFQSGLVTTSLPPGGELRYRIDVPAHARRWIHTATHASTVRFYLAQGTLPTTSANAWSSGSAANRGLNRDLFSDSWPWRPGYPYYLLVRNTATTTQSFTFRMDGRDFVTDDFDNDGLPDAWELAWFSSLSYRQNGDWDGDQYTNWQEYRDGTDPTSANALRITALRPLPDGSLELSIMGVLTNCLHRVLMSSTLEPGSWSTVTNYLQVLPVQTVQVPAEIGVTERFFRVVAPLEITSLQLTPENQVELSIIGLPKRIYRVRSSPTLAPGSWVEVYNYLQTGPIQVLRFPAEPAASQRFYQITAP